MTAENALDVLSRRFATHSLREAVYQTLQLVRSFVSATNAMRLTLSLELCSRFGMAPKAGKRKRAARSSDPEQGETDGASTSATPSPAKKKKSNMTPEEKDAAWIEDHEYGDMTDEEILGTFLIDFLDLFYSFLFS